GTSREKLERDNMASHSEIKEFAAAVGKKCGYKLVDEQEESRVVLMMQQDSPGRFLKIGEINPIQPDVLDAFSRAAAAATVIQQLPAVAAAAAEEVQSKPGQPLFQLKLPKIPVGAKHL
ncbi:hypothetical protein HYU16_02810, partial [Candidatus Woesearchaeota archaeon]|nr:hypothetical protein [Candidatus Woesearchaeota archaeon]